VSKNLKRIVAIAAAAKLMDKVQEMRRPKRSPLVRVAPVAFALAAGGGIAYLAATGRLGPLVDRVRSLVAGTEPAWVEAEGEPREIRLPPDAPTAATAASPTTPITPS
jgi:hypothetical protein